MYIGFEERVVLLGSAQSLEDSMGKVYKGDLADEGGGVGVEVARGAESSDMGERTGEGATEF